MDGGVPPDLLTLWKIRIAAFARAKGRGFFESLEYLARVERALGRQAVLFELELQRRMDVAEAEALKEAAGHKPSS